MSKYNLTVPIGHFAKPSALRHAKRIDRDARHSRNSKPEFDPRDADQWIDGDGKFTIPKTKE